ncbi:MAG: hypothetical protein GXY86_07775 [Firmicutes bacterium]|nr:hypothetical protein [Bacillota bacterium]
MSAVGIFIKRMGTKYQDYKPLEAGTELSISDFSGFTNSGNQLQTLLEAYEIDDVSGVNHWFEEMTKDFLAPQSLPLPFAKALQKVTGMPPSLAMEWLSENVVDLAELGSEDEVIAYFQKNPKIYSACLVLGVAFGLSSDKPILVSANGLQYFNKLKKEGRLEQGIWLNTDRFIRASFSVIDRVCTITFIAEVGFKMAGFSLSELTGDLAESFDLPQKLAAATGFSVDAIDIVGLVDGIANLGLSMLVGKTVGTMVEWLNDDLQQELTELSTQIDAKLRLRELLKEEAPPETIIPLIELMKEQGDYCSILDKRNKDN